MKTNTLSFVSLLSLISLSTPVVLLAANPAEASTPLTATAAAQFGTWFYEVAPARSELLLPLVFVTVVLTLAAIIVHHLRHDQQLAGMSSIAKSPAKTRDVRTPQATTAPAMLRRRTA